MYPRIRWEGVRGTHFGNYWYGAVPGCAYIKKVTYEIKAISLEPYDAQWQICLPYSVYVYGLVICNPETYWNVLHVSNER